MFYNGTVEDFVAREEIGYLGSFLKRSLGDKEKLLWVTEEGDISEKDKFFYDVLESLLEDRDWTLNATPVPESDDTIVAISLDSEDIEVIKDAWPEGYDTCPSEFILRIVYCPGLYDYVLAY